jgi:hypothetical protein
MTKQFYEIGLWYKAIGRITKRCYMSNYVPRWKAKSKVLFILMKPRYLYPKFGGSNSAKLRLIHTIQNCSKLVHFKEQKYLLKTLAYSNFRHSMSRGRGSYKTIDCCGLPAAKVINIRYSNSSVEMWWNQSRAV